MNNSDVSSLLPKLKTTLLTSYAVQHTNRAGVYQGKNGGIGRTVALLNAIFMHNSVVLTWISNTFKGIGKNHSSFCHSIPL